MFKTNNEFSCTTNQEIQDIVKKLDQLMENYTQEDFYDDAIKKLMGKINNLSCSNKLELLQTKDVENRTLVCKAVLNNTNKMIRLPTNNLKILKGLFTVISNLQPLQKVAYTETYKNDCDALRDLLANRFMRRSITLLDHILPDESIDLFEKYFSPLIITIQTEIDRLSDGVRWYTIGRQKKADDLSRALSEAVVEFNLQILPLLNSCPAPVEKEYIEKFLDYKECNQSQSLKEILARHRLLPFLHSKPLSTRRVLAYIGSQPNLIQSTDKKIKDILLHEFEKCYGKSKKNDGAFDTIRQELMSKDSRNAAVIAHSIHKYIGMHKSLFYNHKYLGQLNAQAYLNKVRAYEREHRKTYGYNE